MGPRRGSGNPILFIILMTEPSNKLQRERPRKGITLRPHWYPLNFSGFQSANIISRKQKSFSIWTQLYNSVYHANVQLWLVSFLFADHTHGKTRRSRNQNTRFWMCSIQFPETLSRRRQTQIEYTLWSPIHLRRSIKLCSTATDSGNFPDDGKTLTDLHKLYPSKQNVAKTRWRRSTSHRRTARPSGAPSALGDFSEKSLGRRWRNIFQKIYPNTLSIYYNKNYI